MDQYLDLHFPSSVEPAEVLGPPEALRFPQRVAQLLLAALPGRGRALDVGCAVGGSSFELAAEGCEVLGVDFSEAFVNAAERMRRREAVRFKVQLEGHLEALKREGN